MKLKQIITLGAGLVGVSAIAFGVSAAVPAKTQPATAPTTAIKANENLNFICSNASDRLNQDESGVLAAEYSKKGTADCMFVGCGGVF